jgi:tRNA(fMet)-specific endonuclease VapC
MSARYLLDSSLCIYIAQHSPPAVRARFARHGSRELAMSVITLGELRYAAESSASREPALDGIARLEQLIPVYALPETAGEHYGQIRATLQNLGQAIGNNDLWLAAHARAEGWILVTNHEQAFMQVPGLQVENWVNSHD